MNAPQQNPTAFEPASALELPLPTMSAPLDWTAVFDRPGPSAIEIGTGNGYFIVVEAARLADWNFIGIEREWEFYQKMANRCERAGLANVRTTALDAIDFLDQWVRPGSVDRIYCYFSDPWPKRRHAARRVFTAEHLPLFERALAPGGELWFKTDVPWYYNLAVTIFRERGGWQFLEIGKIPPPDVEKGEALTNFERKAREAGGQVWGFHATMTGGAPKSA